ncbi:MAG: HNH endonuclease [Mycoplasmataceae bacterium]|nr:HNH endonuclease [Mycoplasmataceae bacterium]
MANKDFNDSQRETIWKKYFENHTNGFDVFGRSISKNDFECDHVYPKAKKGPTTIENGIPLSPKSNAEKSDDLQGIINNKKFEVKWNNNKGILLINDKIVTK